MLGCTCSQRQLCFLLESNNASLRLQNAAELINVDLLACRIHTCCKCVLSMRGMRAAAPSRVVERCLKHTCTFWPINLQKPQQTQTDVSTLSQSLLLGVLIEALWWRCCWPHSWPCKLHYWHTNLQDAFATRIRLIQVQSQTHDVRQHCDEESAAQACRPKRWLCSSGVGGDGGARTTQTKWLLSTGWLMIKRDVVYFPMVP